MLLVRDATVPAEQAHAEQRHPSGSIVRLFLFECTSIDARWPEFAIELGHPLHAVLRPPAMNRGQVETRRQVRKVFLVGCRQPEFGQQ